MRFHVLCELVIFPERDVANRAFVLIVPLACVRSRVHFHHPAVRESFTANPTVVGLHIRMNSQFMFLQVTFVSASVFALITGERFLAGVKSCVPRQIILAVKRSRAYFAMKVFLSCMQFGVFF